MNEWEIYFNVKVKPNDEKKYKLSERTELIGLNDILNFLFWIGFVYTYTSSLPCVCV